ncbi:MAG: PIN domain-containing protein [Candidatus Shapirobacteria bacterium]
MIFVDTNYFLRFFLDDNLSQHNLASELFEKASLGKVDLCTDILVILEVYWVLKKYYKIDNTLVRQTVLNILNMNFIELPEKAILRDSLHNIDKFNYDFEDVYHFFYCQANKVDQIATFDKKLSKKFKNFIFKID